MDLLAMRPVQSRSEKALVEYDPPIVPLRYLTYDSMVFLSGVTVVLPELTTQLRDILPRITGSLADAGASWNQVVKVSSFLHRSQRLETYKELFAKDVKAEIPLTEYAFVDGYSSEGKLVEVEVTARLT
jgi:enamine deaminase RidA (YjgF/YER057c/UK114 family)